MSENLARAMWTCSIVSKRIMAVAGCDFILKTDLTHYVAATRGGQNLRELKGSTSFRALPTPTLQIFAHCFTEMNCPAFEGDPYVRSN